MIFTENELRELGLGVFKGSGLDETVASYVVDALLEAELEGLPSHGFSRIPFYADQVLSGKINSSAAVTTETPRPGVVLVNADYGFAFPAIEAGLLLATPAAKSNGVAAMSIGHSHHCGVLGVYAERIAKMGLICLIMSNTPAAMAPWGGSTASFGTNPIAFGCPRANGDPIVIDLSLSKVARGKVMNAFQKGESIPEGWALDKNGNPTSDPAAALKGTMIPLGDAKGSTLALMVEILAAGLSGANYAF